MLLSQSNIRALPFPLQILFPPTAPHSLIILSTMLYRLNTDSSVFIYKELKNKHPYTFINLIIIVPTLAFEISTVPLTLFF
jgi:hypothetical protein